MSTSTSELQLFLKKHHVMTCNNREGAISQIDLRMDETTDEILSLLHELPGLVDISLQDALITDKGLGNISRLTRLEHLDLRSCKNITSAGIRHIANLANLKVLELYDTAIGDDALCHLKTMTSLEVLNLHSTKVTDGGLKELQSLPRLRSLDIGGKTLTDACLQFVGSLHQLEKLYLGESSFTDSGLAFLGQLTRITDLSVAWTKITGIGFEHLGNFKKLAWLLAQRTDFSDDGLKYLAPLKSLKTLYLNQTNVTDEGLTYLTGLSKLKSLYLDDTRVTPAGKSKLKQSLPRCVISISPGQVQVDTEQFDQEYFWAHPPRCIAGFKPVPQRNEQATTYELVCKCGGTTGSVLGYPLSQYTNYRGAEFAGPLAFSCASCRKTTRMIDTAIHGYDGELGSSATIRGKGKRIAFPCAKCGSHEMTVLVHFAYDGAEVDLKEDDPSIAVQDYFGSVSVEGICAKCQSHASIAAFECA